MIVLRLTRPGSARRPLIAHTRADKNTPRSRAIARLQHHARSCRAARPQLPTLPARAASALGRRRREDDVPARGYLTPTGDLRRRRHARAAAPKARRPTPRAAADEIVVLELADGSTLITSAERLRETLRARAIPSWLGRRRTILLERLRVADAAARDVASAMRSAAWSARSSRFVAGEAQRRDRRRGAQGARSKGIARAELGVSLGRHQGADVGDRERARTQARACTAGSARRRKADDLEPTSSRRLRRGARRRQAADAGLRARHRARARSAASAICAPATATLWAALERHFTGGIFAFEHRTLSESPIENALQLAARAARRRAASAWSRIRAAGWSPT